ncbi:hypothetical protein JY651_18485 [Pyxidicoccus parkwayensis]|uniref:Lipoprotein n=1 Tax=Pyxidicoccus parkwayensis TaxID=2813578 RepID=A0ABX7P8E2_9BACT|nr:hypothetical protein [Pyxidicoccus parkwaysis]QSQ26784.1 hypothetical protein JY651_18485 [Pyxidicoccus parkwaysis]
MPTFLPRAASAFACSILMATGLMACSNDDEVSSDEQARRAYLGLDKSIDKALQLGFAGFNAATSANIPPQSANGDASGTMQVTGQVDQGSSANKGMRLNVAMTGYSDGEFTVAEDEEPVSITYSTAADAGTPPDLDLQLKNIPNGTFTGALVGNFEMTGDLGGSVGLNLTLSGEIQDDGTGKVQRKAGTTHVVGTATAGDGTYNVDVTR